MRQSAACKSCNLWEELETTYFTQPIPERVVPTPHVTFLKPAGFDGKDVRCVLIDSVQSQANRLEEALLTSMRAGRIAIPHITVAFKNQNTSNGIDLSDLGEVTSLDAPHRVFDAI